MDQARLTDALGVPAGTIITIEDLALCAWGQQLRFRCTCEPVQFVLAFTDCRDIHWKLYAHTNSADGVPYPATEIVNLLLGAPEHQKPAQVLTDHFGLTLLYGALHVERDGKVVSLSD